MRNSSVDGLIITPTNGIGQDIDKLNQDRIPFVLLDRVVPDIHANSVVLDNHKGAYALTRHLLQNGYSKLGFVTIVSEMSQMADREKGYQTALSDVGIKVNKRLILKIKFDDSMDKMIGSMVSFINRNPEMDGLFFATNYLGVYGLEALKMVNKKYQKT